MSDCIGNLPICHGACCKYFVFNVNMTPDEERYFNLHENTIASDGKIYILNKCKHQKDGKCEIYQTRPDVCKNAYEQTITGIEYPEGCIYKPKVIIMCAGKSTRWGLDYPKQLAEINGERLLDRTIRLVRAIGYEPIVTCRHFFDVDCEQIKFEPEYEIERFYPTEYNVIYLYGDVYYTEKAIFDIFTQESVFFGSLRNDQVNKPYEEIYAVKGRSKDIQPHVEKLINMYKSGEIDRCIGWELYKSYYNLPIRRNTEDFSHLFQINDITTDIDTESELEDLKKGFK